MTDGGSTSDGRSDVDSTYGAVAELFSALASPVRAAIVHRLTEREQSVLELVEALDVSQPLVSQHLARLRHVGLVEGDRRGRQVVYSIVDEHVAHILLDALRHSDHAAAL